MDDDVDEGVDEAEDAVKAEVLVSEPNSLLTKLDLSEVDIYSMYGQNDTVETPGSEIEEDKLLKGPINTNGNDWET